MFGKADHREKQSCIALRKNHELILVYLTIVWEKTLCYFVFVILVYTATKCDPQFVKKLVYV